MECKLYSSSTLLFLFIASIVRADERTFEGYSVFRFVPDTKEKVQLLNSIAFNFDNDPSYMDKVDFWKRPKQVNSTVDIMLAPDVRDEVLSLLQSKDLKHKQIIGDVQHLINSTKRPESELDLKYGGKTWVGQELSFFSDYHRLDEVSSSS